MRPNPALLHAMTLVAVAALVAVPAAAAQDGQPTQHDYRFTWEEHAYHAFDLTNETADGASTNATVDVDRSNVTALRFTLTWDDDVGEEDTLRMVVYDPAGQERARLSDTQTNGTLEATVRVQEMPPGHTTVRAHSDDEAWAVFNSDYPASAAGTGAWRVEVTVVEAGDAETGIPGLGEEDPGQEWTLAVDGAAYAGVLAEKTPVTSPQDEPDPTRNEMPPPGEGEGKNDRDLPQESTRETSILTSRGAQSVLVVVAAALGIAGALLVARRSGGPDA